jgi:hypothetical protein
MGIPHASDREARVASDLCIGHDRLRSFIAGIFAAARRPTSCPITSSMRI